jgi:hypothetical protein
VPTRPGAGGADRAFEALAGGDDADGRAIVAQLGQEVDGGGDAEEGSMSQSESIRYLTVS